MTEITPRVDFEDEITQEIPRESMHELVSSERPTRNLRVIRLPEPVPTENT